MLAKINLHQPLPMKPLPIENIGKEERASIHIGVNSGVTSISVLIGIASIGSDVD